MYRTFLLVTLCIGTSIAAPQQSSFETIADVKPTIFDLPSAVNDGVPEPDTIRESRVINGGRQDSSSDDLDDITTEHNEGEGETTAYPDEATSIYERATEFVPPTDAYDSRSKSPSPRFYSKLSYFQKPNYFEAPSLTNLLDRAEKRKYKSKCRCEKIWNCPKLQISVPRCPNEYFMCCF